MPAVNADLMLETMFKKAQIRGQAGKYLILPPGSEVPSGQIALQSDAFIGFALRRSNLASHSYADVAKSVAYGKQIKVYPLAKNRHRPISPTPMTSCSIPRSPQCEFLS
ncbi:hypothetical protein NLM33_41025 [Bradyrhizobium sp. CCGUVB1N3]|uniref:hypothetical protein n=1 Tax=Bradyrhizobium sp. CCGUVB1N3 TaxID=2949629 RepID=UPI0020B27A81|nr:hypothetical protein [Bradyrhizobium sp. CCGUVB1N3]MCP3476580.1 hypothetical protein [Bradyrhizobium sp. CCGUVB1N3]